MATAVWAAQTARKRLLIVMLALTLVGGTGFLGIKYIEYKHKWAEGLLWGKYYQPHVRPDAHSPADARCPDGGATRRGPRGDVLGADATGDVSRAPLLSQPTDATSWVFQPADTGPRGLLRPGRRHTS